MPIIRILKDANSLIIITKLLAVVLMAEFEYGKRVKKKERIIIVFKILRFVSKLSGMFLLIKKEILLLAVPRMELFLLWKELEINLSRFLC